MKKNFEIPMLNIHRFEVENIITTSSTTGGNVEGMEAAMKQDNYTVTKVDLSGVVGFAF